MGTHKNHITFFAFLVALALAYNNCAPMSALRDSGQSQNDSSLEPSPPPGPNLEEEPVPRSNPLFSEGPFNSKIEWTGFYYPQTVIQGPMLDLLNEVADQSNLTTFLYIEGQTGQQTADTLRANNQFGILYLDIVLGGSSQEVLTNENAARTNYLNRVKQAIQVNSNLIERIKFLSPGEEMYARVKAGNFDTFPVFQNLSAAQKVARMKQLLEETIAEMKQVFPGIPILHVENKNDSEFVPPLNLDVIGVDAYYIPTSELCDSAQRQKFYDETIKLLDDTRAFGKPVVLVPGFFTSSPWRMPSVCQSRWYHDLARFTPGVIGLQYFIYGNYTNNEGAVLLRGLRDPMYAEQKAVVRRLNQEILKLQTPPPATLPNRVAQSFPQLKVQCIASGESDRFLTYTSGANYSCEQACQAFACSTRGTCAQAWGIGSSGNPASPNGACDMASISTSGNLIGKVCCCTKTGCAQPSAILGAIE